MATKTPVKKKAVSKKKTTGTGEGNSQLEKFFTDSLKDIYWAEKALTKALPKMQKAATTEELQAAIEEHLGQTQEQVLRLEQVFELLGEKAQAKNVMPWKDLLRKENP